MNGLSTCSLLYNGETDTGDSINKAWGLGHPPKAANSEPPEETGALEGIR